mgnify:CR=1 FL=1
MPRKPKNYDDPLQVRNRAIKELLLSTDLTYEELRDICNNDLDWEKQDIYIRRRKKSIHLSTICLKAVFAYKMYARWELVKKQRHQYLFVGKNGGTLGLEELSSI